MSHYNNETFLSTTECIRLLKNILQIRKCKMLNNFVITYPTSMTDLLHLNMETVVFCSLVIIIWITCQDLLKFDLCSVSKSW